MKERLIIIGGSLLGREVCNYARDAGFDVAGFLDSREHVLDGYHGYPSVLGTVGNYQIGVGDVFVCAIGDTIMRKKYVQSMIDRGGVFANVIHPTAYVGPNVTIGVGCIICPQAVIDCDLTLGNHVIVNSLSYVSHDSFLEDFVTLSPGCHLGGLNHLHEGVFMGIHSATIPQIELGRGVYVAAGALVTRSIETGRVMGVPAKMK